MSARRSLAVLAALAVGASTLVLAAPAANAADPIKFVVVGTSDVNDSNLVPALIEPEFEKAYPQYDFQYVSQGTGAAINYAKAGTASALIVHAAALENQFVRDGYSAEPYGRAIFWGDYVLLGPAADPAGVMNGASNDIVTAYEKIAKAGGEGKANFVSRGGTPGTTVQEHAIWSLTKGVTTCAVSDTLGGGMSPSTGTGACADPIALPAWYHATGVTQGPNIIAGDTCQYAQDAGVDNNCYVFTDRGTFAYLQSQGQAQNLKIVTRDNAATARGGSPLLVNSFHAYAVNPAKFAGDPSVSVDLTAATTFLNWITSPAVQRQIGQFLGDAGDPPFLPDAAPALTARASKAVVPGGGALTVKGTVRNVVPGTPALNNVTVKLLAAPADKPGATPTVVATGKTDATGAYSISYRPSVNQTYTVATDAITKIEIPTLDPIFGDLLAPASLLVGRVNVAAKAGIDKAKVKNRKLIVKGGLAPAATSGATVAIVAKKVVKGKHKAFKVKKVQSLASGAAKYKISTKLAKGNWKFKVRYANPGKVTKYLSGVLKVKVL